MKPGQGEIEINKEVIIITKYFLPNLNVDSDSVYQMILGLKKLDPNLIIHVVATESKYKGDFADAGKYSNELLKDIKIHRIKDLVLNPAFSFLKIAVDLITGFRLVTKARSLKITNIISLSNPPLISLWHSLFLRKKNFFYWTFDIFPQALVADRILTKSNLIYRLLKKIAYLNPPTSLIALGDYQYQFLLNEYKKPINKVILPCGIHSEGTLKGPLPLWKDSNVITIGYLGNLGRAHSVEFLRNVILAIRNRPQFQLILSVYGFHKAAIDELNLTASGNIQLVDFVDKSHLSLIDIHLVSLKESWSNISVPSKAVSAVCAGSALWFCGEREVDTWSMFEQCSFGSSDQPGAINQILDGLNTEVLAAKKNQTIAIREDLLNKEKVAYHSIHHLLN